MMSIFLRDIFCPRQTPLNFLCLSLAGSSGRNLANVRNPEGIYDAHVAWASDSHFQNLESRFKNSPTTMHISMRTNTHACTGPKKMTFRPKYCKNKTNWWNKAYLKNNIRIMNTIVIHMEWTKFFWGAWAILDMLLCAVNVGVYWATL